MIQAERIRLYEGIAPGSESRENREKEYFSPIFGTEVVTHVSEPSLTPFLPEGGNGSAVIIAPGGGYHALSINSEGNDVARWLNDRGVAAFVLRYRLVQGGEDPVAELVRKGPEQAQRDMAAIAPLAGADGLAAMGLVRARAGEFGIDPERVGFMGFSAGGGVTMTVAAGYDAATRPAFLAPIYAGASMAGAMPVPEGAPPMFLAAASDDQLGLAADSLALYSRWHDAGGAVELHLYSRGGHGFGMRLQGLPSDSWIERFADWLADLGLMAP